MEPDDIQLYIRWGEELDPDVVQQMLQRKESGGDTYVLSPDRKGIFVIDKRNRAVVTYLRLSGLLQKWCLRQWPMVSLA